MGAGSGKNKRVETRTTEVKLTPEQQKYLEDFVEDLLGFAAEQGNKISEETADSDEPKFTLPEEMQESMTEKSRQALLRQLAPGVAKLSSAEIQERRQKMVENAK